MNALPIHDCIGRFWVAFHQAIRPGATISMIVRSGGESPNGDVLDIEVLRNGHGRRFNFPLIEITTNEPSEYGRQMAEEIERPSLLNQPIIHPEDFQG